MCLSVCLLHAQLPGSASPLGPSPFGQPRSYCHLLHASAHFRTSLSLPPSPVSLEFFLFLISFPGDLLSISLLVPIYEFKLISRIVSMKRILPQFVGASQCLRDHWLDITASAYYALPEIWQVLCYADHGTFTLYPSGQYTTDLITVAGTGDPRANLLPWPVPNPTRDSLG